jgi:hypothetical protein
MVPLPVIDEIGRRIEDGTLAGMVFDRASASLVSG